VTISEILTSKVGLGVALLITSLAPARGQAVVEGRVPLPKPQANALPPPRYAGQIGEIAPPDPATAVVYLEGKFPASWTNTPPATTNMLQRGLQFHPALLPVRVGTAVSFPNEDDFYHNVFSYSKVKRFDLGRYRKVDKPAVQVFDKPGVVKLFCEIHQHMRGVILVLDTPYFTQTSTNGVFKLENVPAGRYHLKAWVSESVSYQKEIELKDGETLQVSFEDKENPAT